MTALRLLSLKQQRRVRPALTQETWSVGAIPLASASGLGSLASASSSLLGLGAGLLGGLLGCGTGNDGDSLQIAFHKLSRPSLSRRQSRGTTSLNVGLGADNSGCEA